MVEYPCKLTLQVYLAEAPIWILPRGLPWHSTSTLRSHRTSVFPASDPLFSSREWSSPHCCPVLQTVGSLHHASFKPQLTQEKKGQILSSSTSLGPRASLSWPLAANWTHILFCLGDHPKQKLPWSSNSSLSLLTFKCYDRMLKWNSPFLFLTKVLTQYIS